MIRTLFEFGRRRVGPSDRNAKMRNPRIGQARRRRHRLGVVLATAVAAAVLAPIGAPGFHVAGASPRETLFTTPSESGAGATVAVGSDGNLWFAESSGDVIATSTTDGEITEYPVPDEGSGAYGVVSGPDGNLWFVEYGANRIGRITTDGDITEFPVPTPASQLQGIAAGGDGNLWFVEHEGNNIGRITPDGTITEFPLPTELSRPFSIVGGPDGNVWFTEALNRKIGRITPAGVITEFDTLDGHAPFVIGAGPDGNLWVTIPDAHAIARVTTDGDVTEFPTDDPDGRPNYVATGPDGNVWYSDIGHGWKLGFATPDGDITEYSFSSGLPGGLVAGPDGNLWVATGAGLARVDITPDPTGEFTPLTPARILDTRTALGGHPGTVGPLQSFDLQITGRGGVPATGVAAVVLNVTVTEPTVASFLTVWPSAVTRPVVSNLNFVPGQTVPNLVTVKVGTNGKVSIYNHNGATDVVVDVSGFYADGDGPLGARFHGVTPARILDTRSASALGTGGVRRLQVTGVGGVPRSTGVSGVVMNVTVTEPSASGYLTVWPDGATRPVVSNLNFVPGLTVPNLVVVRVPSNGFVDFYNSLGSTHVVADVVGYFDDDRTTEAGRFVAITPARAFDSRVLSPFPAPGKITQGASLYMRMPAFPFLPSSGMDSVVMNVTVTEPSASGWVAVFPGDQPTLPLASNLNFVPGQTVPNLVISKLGTGLPPVGIPQVPGWVAFFNRFGATHLVVDVAGYYTDAGTTSAEVGARGADASAAGALARLG